jgi:hypothetical protein
MALIRICEKKMVCKLLSFILGANLVLNWLTNTAPIPVAVRPKAWVYCRSLTGIVGSSRSQWLCGLRRGSTAARLLGSWVPADPRGGAG